MKRSLPERIAIVFMCVAIVATLVLGVAVAYEIGRNKNEGTQTAAVGAPVATTKAGGATTTTKAGATGTTKAGATATTAPTASGGGGGGGTPTTAAGGGSTDSGGGATATTSPGGSTDGADPNTTIPTDTSAPGDTSGGGTETTAPPEAGGGSTDTTAPPDAGSGGGGDGGNGPGGSQKAGTNIKVGGIFDETGAVDATVERDTVKAYFNKVNAAGGVNGAKLTLVDCDSKFNTADAKNCSNKLINDDKVFAVVGWTSPNGEDATVGDFTGAGIPVIGGLGTPNEFADPLSFPVTPSFLTYADAMADKAATEGFKDVGLVVVNVDYIAPVKDRIVQQLQARNVAVKDVELVDATKANYSDVVLAFQNKGVASVIAALDPFSYSRLFQGMKGAGFHPQFIGLGLDKTSAQKDYTDFPNDFESVTPLTEPMDHPNDPAVQDYVNTVKTFFPNQVSALDVFSEGSWVAAAMFVDALKRAGPNPDQKAVAAALNATQGFNTGLSPQGIAYAADKHDPARCFYPLTRKANVWTTTGEAKCY